MSMHESLKKALVELRKGKERKFDQTVDLIVNLQKFDVKRNALNIIVQVPNKIKDKKVCGFFETKNKKVDTVTKEQFKRYSDKKELKKLVEGYDFFVAEAQLMPAVATTFGRVLGPSGKMPSPQLGILPIVDDKSIASVLDKINKSVKIRTKEPSIKVAIGKQSMKDEEIIENVVLVYNNILKNLLRNKENIKNVKIKFTMTKPLKVEVD